MVYAKRDIIDGLRRFKEQNGEKYGILALGPYGSYARAKEINLISLGLSSDSKFRQRIEKGIVYV